MTKLAKTFLAAALIAGARLSAQAQADSAPAQVPAGVGTMLVMGGLAGLGGVFTGALVDGVFGHVAGITTMAVAEPVFVAGAIHGLNAGRGSMRRAVLVSYGTVLAVLGAAALKARAGPVFNDDSGFTAFFLQVGAVTLEERLSGRSTASAANSQSVQRFRPPNARINLRFRVAF